jgi:hypothetical protein
MTHRTETSQDEKEVEAQQGFDLSLLWLWPILLLKALMEAFSSQTLRLKALRKTNPRCSEADWLVHVEALRACEWRVRAYLAAKAQSLLAGEALDPADTWVPKAPPAWERPEPRSVRELILRFEALTAVFANPMRFVARHARRLVKTARLADPRQAEASSAMQAHACTTSAPAAASILTPSWTLGTPAPP